MVMRPPPDPPASWPIGASPARRRLCGLLAAACGLARAADAHALMAGLAPDSATRRLDENTARSPWSGVGSLSANGGVHTGVLVHARYVLTAAHVLPPEPTEGERRRHSDGDDDDDQDVMGEAGFGPRADRGDR